MDESFDRQVRLAVYRHFVEHGRAPARGEVAAALGRSEGEVAAAFGRLAAGKALVLQDSGELLMAEPFSAVPTSFLVEVEGGRSYWGNCVWDALGIPAALGRDAVVRTACGDCRAAMTLAVRDGHLAEAAGVVHFLVPARHWWEDVVFT